MQPFARPAIGLLVSVIAAASYVPVFSRIPETRDFPWANLALFGVAGGILAADAARARSWRTLIAALASGAVLAIFGWNVFYLARQLPPSHRAPRVGDTLRDFSLRDQRGVLSPLPRAPLLLIFFRGSFCPMCHSELQSFQRHLADFEARGIRLVAVSVDPPEVSRQSGLGFTVLSDPDAALIRAYDLFHAGGAPDGHDIARPAEFLLDSNRVVRWENLTTSVVRRARPEQVLAAADALALR